MSARDQGRTILSSIARQETAVWESNHVTRGRRVKDQLYNLKLGTAKFIPISNRGREGNHGADKIYFRRYVHFDIDILTDSELGRPASSF